MEEHQVLQRNWLGVVFSLVMEGSLRNRNLSWELKDEKDLAGGRNLRNRMKSMYKVPRCQNIPEAQNCPERGEEEWLVMRLL